MAVTTILRLIVLAAILASSPAAAAGYRLAPYKDALFAYPAVTSSEFNGDLIHVAYVEQRDLFNRDDQPQKRVSGSYVALIPASRTSDLVLSKGGLNVKYLATGTIDGAKAVVVYLHGMNVTRAQGNDDWMFGGNFNRIKNLMVQNGGAYVSADFSGFDEKGAGEIKALLADIAARAPSAAIFLACGSMGGILCWDIAEDADAVKHLAGLVLLGSTHDDQFLASPARKARLPVFFGHGSKDTVYDWRLKDAFFRKVKAAAPDYPIKLTVFDTGVHGTPIRMTDWRLVLNWMLAVDGR